MPSGRTPGLTEQQEANLSQAQWDFQTASDDDWFAQYELAQAWAEYERAEDEYDATRLQDSQGASESLREAREARVAVEKEAAAARKKANDAARDVLWAMYGGGIPCKDIDCKEGGKDARCRPPCDDDDEECICQYPPPPAEGEEEGEEPEGEESPEGTTATGDDTDAENGDDLKPPPSGPSPYAGGVSTDVSSMLLPYATGGMILLGGDGDQEEDEDEPKTEAPEEGEKGDADDEDEDVEVEDDEVEPKTKAPKRKHVEPGDMKGVEDKLVKGHPGVLITPDPVTYAQRKGESKRDAVARALGYYNQKLPKDKQISEEYIETLADDFKGHDTAGLTHVIVEVVVEKEKNTGDLEEKAKEKQTRASKKYKEAEKKNDLDAMRRARREYKDAGEEIKRIRRKTTVTAKFTARMFRHILIMPPRPKADLKEHEWGHRVIYFYTVVEMNKEMAKHFGNKYRMETYPRSDSTGVKVTSDAEIEAKKYELEDLLHKVAAEANAVFHDETEDKGPLSHPMYYVEQGLKSESLR